MVDTIQELDVDLVGNVEGFLKDLERVRVLIAKIGKDSQFAALAFDRQTRQTVQKLERAMGVMSTVEKLQNRDNLSPGEAMRLEKQRAAQQIRDLSDRDQVQQRIHHAQSRRVELLAAVEGAKNKKTKQDLLEQLTLQDHIERKATTRMAAMDRLAGREDRLRRKQHESTWALAEAENKAEQRKRKQADGMHIQLERDAASRIASEEKVGETIVANRQKRQLDIDKQNDRMRKANQLSATERMAMAKKVAGMEVRQLETKEGLEHKAATARRAIDAKTLQMQQAKTAEVKRQLRAEIDLAEYVESRANRRLNAMGRKDKALSASEELAAAKMVEDQKIRSLRNVGVLETRLQASNLERTRMVAQLERTKDAETRRHLIERIRLENHVEAKIRARIALLNREAAAQERSNAGSRRGNGVGNIMSPGYAGAAMARTSVYGMAAMAAYGAFNAIRSSIQFAIELEDKLANLQAIAAVGDDRMRGLSLSILEVARSSKYATLDLVDATTVLAQAGLTATEMEGALESVSKMAIATGTDLSTTSEAITSTLGAFQLQASEANRIGDAMVASLNRSKLTIKQAQQAIQYVGATAFENNIKFEEIMGAAGAMANAGIARGSTIGTGMRQLLVDLQDPSKKLKEELDALGLTLDDIDVKTKGFVPVLETLRDAGFGSAQAYKGLETRSAAAFLVLRNNVGTIEDLIEAQQAMSTATQAAERSMGSFGAQWQRFKNNLNEHNNREMAEPLQLLGKGIDWLAGRYEAYNVKAEKHDAQALKTIASLRAVRDQHLANGEATDAARLAIEIAQEVNGMYNSTLADAVPAMEHYRSKVQEQTETYYSNLQTIATVDEAIKRLLVQSDRYADGSRELQIETLSLSNQFQGLSKYLAGAEGDFQKLIAAMRQYRLDATKTALATANLRLASSQQQVTSSRAAVMGNRGNLNPTAGSNIAKKLAALEANPSSQLLLNDYFVAVDQNRNLRPEVRAKYLDQHRNYANFQEGLLTKRQAQQDVGQLGVAVSKPGQSALSDLGEGNAAVENTDIRMTGQSSGESHAQYAARMQNTAAKAAKDSTDPYVKGFYENVAREWGSIEKQFLAGNRPEKPDSASARRLAREARKHQRNDKKVAETGLKAAKLELDEALEILKEPIDLGDFRTAVVDVHSTLKGWGEARMAAMQEEIKSSEMTAAQADNLRKEVHREIEAKQRDVSRDIAESITKMYDEIVDQADRNYARTMQPYEASVAKVEGKRQASDRTFNRDNTPDYVKSLQDYDAELEGEKMDRAQLDALYTRIDEQRSAMHDLMKAVELAQKGAIISDQGMSEFAKLFENLQSDDNSIVVTATRDIYELARTVEGFTERDLETLKRKLEEGTLTLSEMIATTDALRASLEVAVPPTFSEGLALAARNYRITHGLHRGFEQDITMGLGGAFEAAGGAMETFWRSMLDNPLKAGVAFKAFAQSVIGSLEDMAAKALANQLMGMLISAIGGPTPTSLLPDVTATRIANPLIFFNGGQVPMRYGGGLGANDNGGIVNHGVASRDSVLTGLARGEFVVRKKAVDSLGAGFLSNLNKHGAAALKGLGGSTIIAPQANQSMNVYLVAKDEAPQLGPNDVIAIVDRNILKGGSTKKLIKHVSQGG